jgi:trimeric autotransporter adhesin
MLFEQGMKATATEPFHQGPRKKVEVLSSKTRQPTIQRETLDPAYQKLIDQGVVSAPVKVDPTSPIGTVFTSQVHAPQRPILSAVDSSNLTGNSTDSTSAQGIPIGKPGQMMTDVISDQKAALKEKARAYFATAEAEKANLAQRAAAIGMPLRFEREGGKSDVLLGINDSNDPIYASAHNISGADTLSVDALWPAATVGVWNDPGNTGLNLSGTGEIIGLWEAGGSVRVSHEQFGGRVTQLDISPSPEVDHATGVAGTLASAGIPSFLAGTVNVGTWSRGIAYASSLNAYDTGDFTGEFANEAGSGLKFANNSYGLTTGWVNSSNTSTPIWRWFGPAAASATEDWKFGAYLSLGTITTKGLDDTANTAPNALLVYSAGNDQNEGPGVAVANYLLASTSTTSSLTRDWTDGDDGGYDTMSALGCAKNVLTVGAIQSLDTGWISAAAVIQSPFSSTGPTDDGRIKPEVVAQGSRSTAITTRNPNGFQIVTTGLVTATPNNSTYSLQAGTSFSAPSVTGVLALVNQRRTLSRASFANISPPGSIVVIDQNWSNHPLLASGMRALVAHTADEAGSSPGPDYRFGYGVVNATKAVQLISNDSGAGTAPSFGGPKPYYKEVLLGANTKIQFKISRIDASTPIKVTAAWSDPSGAGQTTNVVDQQTARLVNDLDVRIYPPGVIPSSTTKNAAVTHKPWILNPDLVTKSAATRGAAATTGDDSRNNLEQVLANTPIAGDYTVVVDHKGFTLNGGNQWVSLAISGVTVPIPPNLTASIINNGNGNFAITWPSVVGARYVVEVSGNLLAWTPASGEISALLESTSLSVSSPLGVSTQFWRVIRVY